MASNIPIEEIRCPGDDDAANALASSTKTAASVEAIFLSPDPEEGDDATSTELWRQAKQKQKDAFDAPVNSGVGNPPLPATLPNTSELKKTPASKATGGKVYENPAFSKRQGSVAEEASLAILDSPTTKRVATGIGGAQGSTPGKADQDQSALLILRRSKTNSGVVEGRRLRKVQSDIDLKKLAEGKASIRWQRPRGSSVGSVVNVDAAPMKYLSRRGSTANISIAVSCPDSPVSYLLFESNNKDRPILNQLEGEFVLPTSRRYGKISDGGAMSSSVGPRGYLTARKDSLPLIPRLNLTLEPTHEASETSATPGDDHDAKVRASGSTTFSVRKRSLIPFGAQRRLSSPGLFQPASRPSSVLGGGASGRGGAFSRTSSTSSLGNVSMPWTPTSSPLFHCRRHFQRKHSFLKPVSLVAPLQAINKQVSLLMAF